VVFSSAVSTLLKVPSSPAAREAATRTSSVIRPALVWDPHLANLAEQWAKHLAADNEGLKHSTNEERPGQGENLYWMSGDGKLSDACQGWADEGAAYHGEEIDKGVFESYGHYTQVCHLSWKKFKVLADGGTDHLALDDKDGAGISQEQRRSYFHCWSILSSRELYWSKCVYGKLIQGREGRLRRVGG